MTIKVYGHSDDLIELEGAIREEFPARDDDDNFLAFSDGTVLAITYGRGNLAMWHISRIAIGTAEYTRVEALDEVKNYTDVVTLEGDIRWCVFGHRLEKISAPA